MDSISDLGKTRLKGHSGWMFLRLLITAALVFGLVSCHGQKKPPPKPWETPQDASSPEQIKWSYMPGALTINIKADENLNPFEGFTHNVMLCIYQLDDPAPFQELAANKGGIRKLLECGRFDESVVKVDRRFIQPGEETSIVLDRAEGGRHVGLAAGYNEIQPGMMTSMSSFPVTEHRGGMWPWSSKVYNPGTLTMDILLGPDEIQRMGVE